MCPLVDSKLDRVPPKVADPPPANSTTDTGTHPISYGQPNYWWYGQNLSIGNPPLCITMGPLYWTISVEPIMGFETHGDLRSPYNR